MRKLSSRQWILILGMLALTTVGVTQIRSVIKAIGVAAAVDRFGPDIDRQFNRLTKHQRTDDKWTKVVPILSIGVGRSSAIGAVQVMGQRALVEKVVAVAAPEAELFGREVRIRAMIPISNKDADRRLDTVSGVGVSGIVDLKL